MTKFVLHQDLIPEFIPNTKVKMVILGTMASYMARSIDYKIPDTYFYYHSGHNRFWDILSSLHFGEKKKFSTVDEKKSFLNDTGIALSNLVCEATLKEDQKSDDTHLFEAVKENRLKFKKLSPEFKNLFHQVPILFTCYRKKPIEGLLEGFFKENGIAFNLDQIHFLHSPTRRSYEYIAGIWRQSMPFKVAG